MLCPPRLLLATWWGPSLIFSIFILQPAQLIFSFSLAEGDPSSYECFLISVDSFSLGGKRKSRLFYTYIKWKQNEEVTVGLLKAEERVGRR